MIRSSYVIICQKLWGRRYSLGATEARSYFGGLPVCFLDFEVKVPQGIPKPSHEPRDRSHCVLIDARPQTKDYLVRAILCP